MMVLYYQFRRKMRLSTSVGPNPNMNIQSLTRSLHNFVCLPSHHNHRDVTLTAQSHHDPRIVITFIVDASASSKKNPRSLIQEGIVKISKSKRIRVPGEELVQDSIWPETKT